MNRRIAVTLTAVALAATLSACGSSDDDSEASAPKKTPAPSASAAPAADAEAAAGIPPKPDAATQARYIRALNAIDPGIVDGDEDKAVSRGRDQCSTIHNFPKDAAKQADLANQRFTSPSHPEGFGMATAPRIVKAVHSNLCPDF
ncbi:hypothetical protein PH213_16890 [Streptomyces sp. SRF1]|uniref:hypothetical protein n=1 Tax=Streptomyces sp. SRF1 TaxID=1549642 RepID=UPI0025AED508|nr:hypothetical protein [Streptomyces sp. SRF1]MDN3056192.1 hypothetical protein [Streptomyces sp. SRF1]